MAHRYPLHPGNILLNMAVGAPEEFTHAPSDEAFPNKFKIDYVKHYAFARCKYGAFIQNNEELGLLDEYNYQRGYWFEVGGQTGLAGGSNWKW